MSHHIVAIDTGSNGGICSVIYEEGNPEPTYWLERLQGDNDKEAYTTIHKHLATTADLRCVYVEKPPYFMGTMIPSSRIAVLFECYGKVVGYLDGRGVGDYVVQVPSQVWQEPIRDILGYKRGKMTHSKWKQSLTQHAKANFPDVKNLTNQTTDALLIARWAHNKRKSELSL